MSEEITTGQSNVILYWVARICWWCHIF